jgi:translation initiation factor 4E
MLIFVFERGVRWVFWFRQQRAPGDKIKNYEEGIKKIGAVSSVESFWSVFTHLTPPSALVPTTDILVFHSGVRRPIWEDSANAQGGKWILRLKKGVADRMWEELVLAVIGDQFEDGEMAARAAEEDGWPEICGVSISVRLNEDIISLWNRFEADHKSRDRIKYV